MTSNSSKLKPTRAELLRSQRFWITIAAVMVIGLVAGDWIHGAEVWLWRALWRL